MKFHDIIKRLLYCMTMIVIMFIIYKSYMLSLISFTFLIVLFTLITIAELTQPGLPTSNPSVDTRSLIRNPDQGLCTGISSEYFQILTFIEMPFLIIILLFDHYLFVSYLFWNYLFSICIYLFFICNCLLEDLCAQFISHFCYMGTHR